MRVAHHRERAVDAERPRRLDDQLLGLRLDAAAAIQHTVDSDAADAGRRRYVIHARLSRHEHPPLLLIRELSE